MASVEEVRDRVDQLGRSVDVSVEDTAENEGPQQDHGYPQ